jgi:hypothetical protein
MFYQCCYKKNLKLSELVVFEWTGIYDHLMVIPSEHYEVYSLLLPKTRRRQEFYFTFFRFDKLFFLHVLCSEHKNGIISCFLFIFIYLFFIVCILTFELCSKCCFYAYLCFQNFSMCVLIKVKCMCEVSLPLECTFEFTWIV